MRRKWTKRDVRTLERLFESPTRADVTWSEVVRLVERCGGVVENARRGSGRRVRLGDRRAWLHAPHEKEMPKGAVEGLRDLFADVFGDELESIGAKP